MNLLTVRATIKAPLNKVWNCWTEAAQVQHWNFASSDWHCPAASNNLIVGGEFHYTMAAKDNSEQFDETNEGIVVTEQFEPENQNSIELQEAGWQSILDNFKSYVEKDIS